MSNEPDGPAYNKADFLIHMYNQMFSDINRHIIVIWQSVGVLVGAFALLSLVEKNIVPIDIGVSLIIIIAIWLIANIYDAAYWYNRNLCIIANIERHFLNRDDLKTVHYYFGKHRPENKMITHLRIQLMLALGVWMLVLLYQFIEKVMPAWPVLWNLSILQVLPYVTTVVGIVLWIYYWQYGKRRYNEFLRESPGLEVDTEGVSYGAGHGHK